MPKMFNLLVTTIVKNEEEYLEEWLGYHLNEGVDHFLIYDNGSTDRTHSLLRRYANHGFLTLLSWPMQGGQVDAYNHALRFSGHTTEWMAFIDIDEFINLHGGKKLGPWLSQLPPDISQVQFPWRNYTFGGHVTKPNGLVTENFRFRAPDVSGESSRIGAKSIVRPQFASKMYVHSCALTGGKTIDPAMRELENQPTIRAPDYSFGQINHYYTKSVDEYRAKITRGQVDGGAEKTFHAPSEAELWGVEDPMPAEKVEAVGARLEALRRLPEDPAHYGSALKGFPHHNGTQWHFEVSFWNAFTAQPRLSNGAAGQRFYCRKWGFMALDLGTTSPDMGAILGSIHIADFRRRNKLEFKDIVRRTPSQPTSDACLQLAWESEPSLRKMLFFGLFRATPQGGSPSTAKIEISGNQLKAASGEFEVEEDHYVCVLCYLAADYVLDNGGEIVLRSSALDFVEGNLIRQM